MTGEMLPTLTTHHFRDDPENIRYQLAVVEAAAGAPVYQSTPAFSPDATTRADAAAELFQVRPQEFPELVADVRRFSALTGPGATAGMQTFTTFTLPVDGHGVPATGKAAPARARDPIALAGDRARGAFPVSGGRPGGSDPRSGVGRCRHRPPSGGRRRNGGC